MITDRNKPIWFDYVEMDDNLNQRLRADTPEDVRRAYEQHLQEIDRMSRSGQYEDKA